MDDSRRRCRSSSRFLTLLTAVVAASLSLLLVPPPPLRAAEPEEVQRAIDRGVKFLYDNVRNDNWEWTYQDLVKNQKPGAPIDEHQGGGGATALVVYALVAAGEAPQEPRIAAAVESIRATEVKGVYALGLRCAMWSALPRTDDNRKSLGKDVALLKSSLKKNRKTQADGFFWYQANNKGDSYDHSVSQIGVLGLASAAQAGQEVARADWSLIDLGWRKHQYAEGSWSYQYEPKGNPVPFNAKKWSAFQSTVSMTAAGVATLFITQDMLRANEGIQCKGNLYNDPIDRGMAWISQNFGDGYMPPYSMYTMARIGGASGHKYLARDFDWYDRGADHLIKRQGKDGSWRDHGHVVGTAFGVLFLSRGRAPVVMSKLDYSPAAAADPAAGPAATKPAAAAATPRLVPGQPPPAARFVVDDWPWNQRPRDAASVTRWIGRQLERDLNRQIVNLGAPLADLHDGPILYVAGNKELKLTPAQEAKLKAYVESGGLVLGTADCDDPRFAESFRKLGQRLFPAYEFANLPAGHVIFTNQQFNAANWKNRPAVLALSNGARVLMVLLPQGDAGRAWAMNMERGREEIYQFAANLFLYAVDKQNLRFKGERFVETPDPKIKPDRTIKVARLRYAGNFDPEPGGWRRMAAVMHNRWKTDLAVDVVQPGEGKLKPGDYAVAHLTGTGALRLDAAARAEIKAFATGGGTLVIDACGGSGEFANAVDQEMAAIFGDDAKLLALRLKPDHPLYAGDGKPLGDVGYRTYARDKLNGSAKDPQLRAIEVKGRPMVVYSREDLSVGMVGQPVDGILGYDPKTATTLMTKILLFATGGPPAPTPAAAAAVKKGR